MVKKLFKYEIFYYVKRLLPFYIVLLSVSAFTRIIELFERDALVFDIVYTSSIIAYVVALIASVTAPFILAIMRFYKNLYTAEGYLSFTLPVTPTQHIFVKTATAMLFDVISLALTILSIVIISLGDLGYEIGEAIKYLFRIYFEKLEVHGGFYIAEVVILLFIASLFSLFVFYTCITVGQLAKKNRVAASVGVYFGFYLIEQIIGTICVILVAVVSEQEWWLRFIEKVIKEIKTYIHIGLLGYIVILAVIGTGFFFINRRIMRKKLNLE